jgi:hypothetical protein
MSRRKASKTAGFSPRQERFATLIAAGRSLHSAASEVGVSDRQAYTWKNMPGFAALVARHQRELFAQAVAGLAGSLGQAVASLVALLGSADEKIVLASARAIISDLVTLRNAVDVESRLAALEQRSAEVYVNGDDFGRGLALPRGPIGE